MVGILRVAELYAKSLQKTRNPLYNVDVDCQSVWRRERAHLSTFSHI